MPSKPKLNRQENKNFTILLKNTLKKPTDVLAIDEFVINIKGQYYWIGNRFFSYGNLWRAQQTTKQPSIWNKYLLYRITLRTEKLKKRLTRRF